MSTNLTERCVYEVKFFLKSLLTFEYNGPFDLWTLEFLDSMFKMPSGIATGNINWLGDYDQCVNIEVHRKGNTKGRPDFKGEYCLIFVVLQQMEGQPPPPVYPKLGMCLPSGCTTYDKLILINYWLFLMPFKLGIQEDYCYTKEGPPWNIYGTIAVLMIVGLVLMGVAGTFYEYLLTWDEANNLRYQFRFRLGEIVNDVLLAFSFRKNTVKIFNLDDDSSSISTLHGLKTISMLWITAVHVTVMTFQDYPWRNQLNALRIAKEDSWIVQLFADAALTTDTFFVISGLLVTYVTLNTIKKLKIKFNVVQFYIYRYWRLTPPYAVILAIISGLVVHLGEGPTWALVKHDAVKCQDKWWRNILYIQNLFPDFYDQCLLPSWYLAVDTQMYLVAPLFLIPLIKKPKLGVMLLIVVTLITTISPGILTYIYDLETYTGIFSRKPNMDMFADMIYNKPWNRMSTYLIGMLTGYYMYAKGKSVPLKQSTVIGGWLLSLFAVLLILFGPMEYFRGKQMPPLLYVLYGSLTRPAWGCCIAWTIYACYIGYGGVLNSLLSWKGLIPISRLSYSFYLSHMLVIHHYYYSRQDNLRVEYLGMITMALGIGCISLFTAYLLAVIVEAPFIQLLNILVRNRTKDPSDKKELKNGNAINKNQTLYENDYLIENSGKGVINVKDTLHQDQEIHRRRQSPNDKCKNFAHS